jgi:hypothetical protein
VQAFPIIAQDFSQGVSCGQGYTYAEIAFAAGGIRVNQVVLMTEIHGKSPVLPATGCASIP